MAQVQGAGEMDGQIDLAVPWFELQSRPMAVPEFPTRLRRIFSGGEP